MAWTGIASDLTLTDVAGPAYPISLQPGWAPKPIAHLQQPVSPAIPNPVSAKPSWLYKVGLVALFAMGALGALSGHPGNPTSGMTATRPTGVVSDPAAEPQHAPATGHAKRDTSPESAHTPTQPASPAKTRVRPHPATQSTPALSRAVPDDAEVGGEMTLEHFRNLSGKI
jgi:hypothetical protein